MNCNILKTARCRNFKFSENAFKAYPNILVYSEKLELSALLRSISFKAETKIGLRFVREFGAVASASATTFYGIPEPVKNARVVNDATTSACVIEWENFGYNVKEAIGYKVG